MRYRKNPLGNPSRKSGESNKKSTSKSTSPDSISALASLIPTESRRTRKPQLEETFIAVFNESKLKDTVDNALTNIKDKGERMRIRRALTAEAFASLTAQERTQLDEAHALACSDDAEEDATSEAEGLDADAKSDGGKGVLQISKTDKQK